MSNASSFPQTYISSVTNQENALIYKSNAQKKQKLSPLKHYSSLRDLSNKNYGDDIEKINQEMNIVNLEIKLKNKEYELIKKDYDKLEKENIVVLNILDSLISECQEIEEPLEKRAKDIDNEENKTQLLINKLKNKYDLFKKELSKKEEELKKLKENERTIRLFELDDKIKNAKIDLIQVK